MQQQQQPVRARGQREAAARERLKSAILSGDKDMAQQLLMNRRVGLARKARNSVTMKRPLQADFSKLAALAKSMEKEKQKQQQQQQQQQQLGTQPSSNLGGRPRRDPLARRHTAAAVLLGVGLRHGAVVTMATLLSAPRRGQVT